MSSIKIPTSFNIDLEFETADLIQRFWAWLIDLAVRIVFVLLVYFTILGFGFYGTTQSLTFILAVVIPVSMYFLLSEIIMGGQTIGKKVMHIKVVSMLGNQPSFSQHMIRWLFRIIESPFIFWGVVPILSVARSPYNQRLGDVVAGTIVIHTRQKASLQDTIFRDMSQTDYEPHFPQIMKLSDKDLNKIKELMDRALQSRNVELATRVSLRVREVLHIQTNMDHLQFLETVLNDYNYYTTREER